jgi:hypothetical protein
MDRRAFLAESAKTAVGAALLSGAAQGADAAPQAPAIAPAKSPNDKVVLAIIGSGGRGSGVIMGLANQPNVEVEYICDPNRSRGADLVTNLEKKQGRAPKRVEDMRRVFEDKNVDGVLVSTPEHWHALATVWACQAGKDVYVEKNISMTPWEGRKMVEAARKYKRIVQCGTQNRSAPYGFSAREFIQSGKLGRVVHVKVTDFQYGRFPDRYHQPNFIECIRSRKLPNGDIEQGHLSACLVHLGNLSYKVGNKYLLFDGKTEKFLNSDEANALLKPGYRKDYRIPDEV